MVRVMCSASAGSATLTSQAPLLCVPGAAGPLNDQLLSVSLTEEEVALVEAMMGRVRRLAAAAAAAGVRLMVDAEHTYFQPVGGRELVGGGGVRGHRRWGLGIIGRKGGCWQVMCCSCPW